jgi:hypothetical protein
MPEPSFAIPITLFWSAYRFLWGLVMPVPEILRDRKKSLWPNDPDRCQWKIGLSVKRGLARWEKEIKHCRLYYIRKDYGPLDSPPEGIWLKWIVDGEPVDSLAITLEVGRTYDAIAVVRNWREGTAYVANEKFIESKGIDKKWPLFPGRDSKFINDDASRYTFWLEIRSGKKSWRSKHFYAVTVPPAGEANDKFTLQIIES